MTVSLFISDLKAGGAQKQILLLAEQLAQDEEVFLITWWGNEFDFFQVPVGVKRVSLSNSKINKKFKIPLVEVVRKLIKARIILKKNGSRVVVSFLYEINALAVLSSFGLRNIKRVLSIRNYPEAENFKGKMRIYKVISRGASVFVVQNEKISHWINEVYPRHEVKIIPNYKTYPLPTTLNTKAVPIALMKNGYILAAGTKLHQKGFDLLVSAFSEASRNGLKEHLAIVGLHNKVEINRINKQIEELNLKEQITVYPPVGNMRDWLTSCEFFVLSSRFEGIPNILIEALALKIPSIAFDCPTGPRELLQDGEFGILVPCGDVDKLTVSMIEMSQDKKLRKKIRNSMREMELDNSARITELWRNVIFGN